MAYAPFYEKFTELAETETRSMILLYDIDGVPAGEYTLIEMFCNDPDCDCRRVFFTVRSSVTEEAVAVIAYGWASAQYYAEWLGEDNPKIIRELQGPILNLASPQSAIAPALLNLIEKNTLSDSDYIKRIKRHYKLFRAAVDADTPQ